MEHSGDTVLHLVLTIILPYLFPGRTSDFYSVPPNCLSQLDLILTLLQAVRLALESNQTFAVYLIQCGEKLLKDHRCPKDITDKFETCIGILFEQEGLNSVIDWTMDAFRSVVYDAVDAYDDCRGYVVDTFSYDLRMLI